MATGANNAVTDGKTEVFFSVGFAARILPLPLPRVLLLCPLAPRPSLFAFGSLFAWVSNKRGG